MEERMNQPIVEPVVEAPVLFEERAAGDRRIGVATLNVPKALNGLSLEMARLLDAKLSDWANDDAIVVVVLQGAGDKAFCAGGDLRGLYRSMLDYRASGESDIRANAYATDFFQTEYRLDYRIHTFPKPVMCWGDGIVMGGGIGLMAGASHRVVTERSRLAMPEITVGLYPDVGGSWLLNQVPDRAGLFLALTGAPLNAGDAVHAGLADYRMDHGQRDALYDALTRTIWSGDALADATALSVLLKARATMPGEGPLQQHRLAIMQACASDNLDDVVAAIAAIDSDDAWLTTAQHTLATGAPGSARLAFELQQRVGSLSLADTFRLEYIVSLHCAAHGDFAEGIRALLIDKDRNPHWDPATAGQASAVWAEAFFRAPWTDGHHPLKELGARASRLKPLPQ
jgi:enoyl-CoA hydratase/carnithine racemase